MTPDCIHTVNRTNTKIEKRKTERGKKETKREKNLKRGKKSPKSA